jgi:hypothetical protein
MQSKQDVCVLTAARSRQPWTSSRSMLALMMLCLLVLGYAGIASAQVNTATLSGTVVDPQGLPVKGAKITVTNAGTGAERNAVTDDDGRYNLVGLPPGKYKMTADGGANFATYENSSIVLTVGESATFDPRLELRSVSQSVTVSSETAPIETTKTEVSQTVEQRRIDNLPINGRSYINFTLTNSQTKRDDSPTIGPAPNSGLSVGGARARSSMVSVDGADAVDNSVNGIRATVSQEAVQEFQLILSNYNAEYGRATGGVINIVTKGGGNEFHGNVFGFLRNKSFQARDAFSGQVDPAGNIVPTKQAYTRVQAGATLGGAFRKDKSFYFFSYEDTLREETGFSSIGAGNFGVAPFQCGGCQLQGLQLTPSQAGAVGQLLQAAATSANPLLAGELNQIAGGYAALMGSASSVALTTFDPGLVATNFGLNPGPGHQFPIPVPCPPNQTINGVTCSNAGFLVAPLPLPSFVGLNSLRGNYPITEKTSLWSGRLDQRWNDRNTSFLRVGVSPSLVTGLQSTSQNQVLGQNSGSRTGLSQSRDLNVTIQHDTIVSNQAFNEFRFQFARRGVHFGFSQLPGGSAIGVNIPGFAYFGREPYSPVDRIEKRYEFTDHVSLVRGRHTFKMGGDVNVVQLRTSKQTIFQLDFGGDVNFGALAASNFRLPDCVNTANGFTHAGSCSSGEVALPETTGFQSYGLGVPSTYIQGIGAAKRPFDNLPFGFFFQDSWRVNRNFTVNYGVRYDVEITPIFPALTLTNQAAEKALGVVEGIPRDYNNVAPRLGLAWDPKGDGKTVVRAGYGIFYDHPLLAVAFDALTVEGGQSVQLLSLGGPASACGVVPAALAPPGYPLCNNGSDGPGNLNGSSIFQGVLNALPNMGYVANQQRFNPFAANSLFANQNYLAAGFPLPILPFTLPVDKNFRYGYAPQANLTIEREITGSWKVSAGYQYTRGLKLYRAVNINSTDPQLLVNNLVNADAAGLGFQDARFVLVPSADVPNSPTTCGLTVNPALGLAPAALGMLTGCPSTGPLSGFNGKFVGNTVFFNFFRPSGPNPSFAGLVPGGFGTQRLLAREAGFPVGFGVPVPFNSVDAQKSIGNSFYHALTVNVTKRFSKGFELLSSYTWSHSIDDSADLQSTLEPADSRFPQFERSNSYDDQRHRWVTSAVLQSSGAKSSEGFFKHFIADFTLAPIMEVASGRPFNVITGGDSRLDLGTSQARPSLGGATTSPFIPGVTFSTATVCLTNSGTPFSIPPFTPPQGCDGNLGRNRFVTPSFFQFDLRVSKRVPLGERLKLDLIADAFNLFNRLNVAGVNQLCDPASGATCPAGQPTAAYDARQFQFALKVSW